jgi:hypothetical protein
MLIPLLLVACGGGSTGNTASATPTSAVKTAKATLTHVPTGSATLDWDSTSKTLTVKITLTGLAPNSIHPEHIHTGSCSNQGAVLYPLAMLKADGTGDATSTTTVPNVKAGIPASGWFVNVHNGPALTPDAQYLPIVCGNVANSNTSTSAAQSVQVTLNSAPAASAGQSAMGTAELTLNGTTLTVKVTLSGLAPNSSHTSHIHKGSCAAQGDVMFPLTTIVADASGNATATTTIPNVTSIPSSGGYVNIHNSTALTTQTGFDPIACGDVTLG